MPKYDAMEWNQEQLIVCIKPKGVRRWLGFLGFYLTGSVLDVNLCVKSESHDAQKYEYTWELQYWSQLHEKHIIEKHDNGSFMAPAHGVLKIPLDTHLFLHEGEYHLIVNMIRGIDKQQENKVQTLVTFKVLSYDVFYADVFKTLMVGFLGAIVGALLTIYFTKR